MNDATDEFVRKSLQALLQRSGSLTSIPVPINPSGVFAIIVQTLDKANSGLKQQLGTPVEKSRQTVKALFDRLIHLDVADPDSYQNGAPATQVRPAGSSASMLRMEAESIVGRNTQFAEANLAFLQKAIPYAAIAITIALILITLTALGLAFPMLRQLIGENGSLSDITLIAWAIVASTSVCLAVGAASIAINKPRTMRISPWSKWAIGLAVAAVLGRYVANEMIADFELIDSLRREYQQILRIVLGLGTGVILFLLDVAAGRMLAYAWLRVKQRNDQAIFERVIVDGQAWHAARIQHLDTSANCAVLASITQSELYAVGVQMVVEAVSNGLIPHRLQLQQLQKNSGTYCGTASEEVDLTGFQELLEQCDNALEVLIQMAGSKASAPDLQPAQNA